MPKLTPAERAQLKDLKSRLKTIQTDLVVAKRKEGIDDYVTIKVGDRQARFERTRVPDGPDKAVGTYLLKLTITAKQTTVLVPLSASSSKQVSGFMYHIEGTGEASVVSAEVKLRGDNTSVVTVGAQEYAKVAPGTTAEFRLFVTIRGKIGKKYHIVINRINYKFAHTDARYQQYLKPIVSKSATAK